MLLKYKKSKWFYQCDKRAYPVKEKIWLQRNFTIQSGKITAKYSVDWARAVQSVTSHWSFCVIRVLTTWNKPWTVATECNILCRLPNLNEFQSSNRRRLRMCWKCKRLYPLHCEKCILCFSWCQKTSAPFLWLLPTASSNIFATSGELIASFAGVPTSDGILEAVIFFVVRLYFNQNLITVFILIIYCLLFVSVLR